MPGITALGTGSGIDLENMVKSLMAVERQSITRLQPKQTAYNTKLSGLGMLSSALSSIKTAASSLTPASGQTMANLFTKYTASIKDDKIATVTATGTPAPGAYSFEVSQLAQSHRLGSVGLTNADITVGSKLKIDLGTQFSATAPSTGFVHTSNGRPIDITIDSTNNTLAGLRDAINKADRGVSASIVNGTGGERLVLTSNETGLGNVMKVTGTDGLATAFDYDPTTNIGTSQEVTNGGQAAQKAKYTVNGIAGESNSNIVDNLITGLSLTLSKTTEAGTPTSINVTVDKSSAAKSALSTFVTSFNAANTTITSLGSYNAKTGETGILQGQSVLQTSQNALREVIFANQGEAGSRYQTLNSIGITLDKTGKMALDSVKLNAALEADYDGVMKVIQNAGTSFSTTTDRLVGTKGAVTNATSSVNKMVTALASQAAKLESRMTTIEARYRKQFANLDTMISNMNSTSNYMTQLVAGLNANSGAR